MHLLLIHQNFPGQFRDLAPAWLKAGHRITALGSSEPPPDDAQWHGLQYIRYGFDSDLTWLDRGTAVAAICRQLLDHDERPDLVLCHSAWGEALKLTTACAGVPWISYPELWGTAEALGFGFDHALDGLEPNQDSFSSQNLMTELALLQSDAAVVASRSQWLSFPEPLRKRLSLQMEGVDLERIRPDRGAQFCSPDHGLTLKAGQPIVTFISRDMEPLRGLRQLLRAWPGVSQAVPTAQLLLVGGEGRGYGLEAAQHCNHLDDGLNAMPIGVDRSRIHRLGHLNHQEMLQLLQCSACHVALSYPYTLSWSVLEAMACGAPLISNHGSPIATELGSTASNTIKLIPFNSVSALEHAIVALLQQPLKQRKLGDAAREWVSRHASLSQALQGYEALFSQLRVESVTQARGDCPQPKSQAPPGVSR